MTLVLADRAHPLRGRLERTVRAVFLAEYGAYVPQFPHRLIAFLNNDGAPRAIAGLRFAEDGLFSSAYLDGAAELVLARYFGRPVSQGRIVEFSSLAAPSAGAAMPLVGAAIRLCRAAGADFGLFTATARLRTLLRRSGLAAVDLGPARSDRLDNAAAWGSYYRHDPRVLAVAADSLPPMLLHARAIPEAPCHA